MTSEPQDVDNAHATKNSTVVLSLLAIIIGMACLTFAAVPIYNLFCKVTGYGGTTKQVDSAAQAVGNKMMTVRFNADTSPDLPWNFQPEQAQVNVRTGENNLIFYQAENISSKPVTGVATFNVVPEQAAKYFNKVECFCFSEQLLQPGEKITMPVSFFIDPAIEKDQFISNIHTVTLSYTFFPSLNLEDKNIN